jgi:transposase
MQIVSALDVHRRQITFRTVELASGESQRGRISPVAREPLRVWLAQFQGADAEFVLEGTTGWRFVVEEIERAGHRARLADPAETAARRGASGARRPTRATASCSCGCYSRVSCPRPGSHQSTSWSCAPASACARR